MVAKVRRTKFDVSEPFLLVVQFPTVMPRGYSGEVFVEPSPTARLLPGQCLVPCGGKMPFLCGCLRDLRKLSPKDTELHPHALSSNSILGFGQKAFSHVLVPVSALPDDDAEYWPSLAQDWTELLCTPTGSLDSDLRAAPADAYNDGFGGIRIPVMLPLASPLCLPAGILGHPSIGIEGVRAVLTEGVSTPNELSTAFLELPIVRAWLTAAMEFPDVMTIEVMGRGAVSQSLRSSTVSTATQPSLGATNANTELAKLANIGVHDYWRAMESTLAFRFFIDNISGAAKPHRSAGPFYRYLTTAGNGLYHLDNILGQRPAEMGYEVLVLRPPLAAKRWKEMFNLDQWTTNSSTCPTFLREYKSQSIDPATTATYPLRRNDGSLDPPFPSEPEFPEATAYIDPFAGDDPRIIDQTSDTYYELAERRILDSIQQIEQGNDPDDLFPDNENELQTLQQKLETHKRWPCLSRKDGRHFRGDPTRKRNPGQCADPLEFLNASAAKRARNENQASANPSSHDSEQPNTPPRPADRSGIRPRNVDPLQAALYGLEDTQEDLPVNPSSEDATDAEPQASIGDGPDASAAGADDRAPLDRLRSMFPSPLGDSDKNPIVIDAGTRESLIAQLRRRHPVADKNGNVIPLAHRSLFDDGSAQHAATASASNATPPSGAAAWNLHDPRTNYPTYFTFWSLLLAYRETSFVGTFNGVPKTVNPSIATGASSPRCLAPEYEYPSSARNRSHSRNGFSPVLAVRVGKHRWLPARRPDGCNPACTSVD
jgi:hypothetical protein